MMLMRRTSSGAQAEDATALSVVLCTGRNGVSCMGEELMEEYRVKSMPRAEGGVGHLRMWK